MKIHVNLLGVTLVTLLTTISGCGPELSKDEPDPEQIIAAFCDNLFRCPETRMLLGYDSIEDCEVIHRDDYEMRDATCQERVLMFEECLSELSCDELAVDRPCSEDLDFLTERCHGL